MFTVKLPLNLSDYSVVERRDAVGFPGTGALLNFAVGMAELQIPGRALPGHASAFEAIVNLADVIGVEPQGDRLAHRY